MNTHPCMPPLKTTVFRQVAIALGLVAATASGDQSAEPAIGIKVPCSNPAIVTQFVAAEFPRDIVLIKQAFRDNVCRYIGVRTPVIPVRFIAAVTASPDAAEPVAYVWAVRLPDGEVAYSYFWKADHEVMLKDVATKRTIL